jgi:hypothetical protein
MIAQIIYETFACAAFISAWTLGVAIVTEKGMIGYFMKEQLENWAFKEKRQLVEAATTKFQGIVKEQSIQRIQAQWNVKEYIAKPILLCVYCMPSVHGLFWMTLFGVIDSSLGRLNTPCELLIFMITTIAAPVMAVFFNAFINRNYNLIK